MTYLHLGHYVYCHLKPDGSVFYIGKGSGDRAYRIGNRNIYWKNVFKKYGEFKVQILAAGMSNKDALNFEKTIITASRNNGNIKLCNLTDGGDGAFNPSIETRKKQREAKLGRVLSDEHKRKIRAAHIGHHRSGWKLSKDQCDAIAERTRMQIWTAERCRRISEAKTGHHHSEETKNKISAAKRGVPWSDARIKAQERIGK